MSLNTNNLITGSKVFLEELGTYIHQPTVKQALDEQCFIRMLNIFTSDLSEFIDGETSASLFEIILYVIIKDAEDDRSKQWDLARFFKVIMPDYNIDNLSEDGLKLFSPNEGKTITIGNENFDIFREALIKIFRLEKGGKGSDFNPADDRAKEIAEKLKKARNIVAQQKKEQPPTISDYITILAVGLQMDIRDLLELTLYQLFSLLERFNLYTTFKMDCDLKLAGGSGLDSVEYWAKSIN